GHEGGWATPRDGWMGEAGFYKESSRRPPRTQEVERKQLPPPMHVTREERHAGGPVGRQRAAPEPAEHAQAWIAGSPAIADAASFPGRDLDRRGSDGVEDWVEVPLDRTILGEDELHRSTGPLHVVGPVDPMSIDDQSKRA